MLTAQSLARRALPLLRPVLFRRGFRTIPPGGLRHGYKNSDVDPASSVRLTFVTRDSTEIQVNAPDGATLLEIAHANDVELEGACEGSLACSTCHVYLDEANFSKLEEPCDDENDMLDLAFALTEQYVYILYIYESMYTYILTCRFLARDWDVRLLLQDNSKICA